MCFGKTFYVPRGNIWTIIPGVLSIFMTSNAIWEWQVWIHYRYTLLTVSHSEIYTTCWSLSLLVPDPDKTKPSDSGRHHIDQKTRLPSITSRAYQSRSDMTTENGAALNLKRSQSLLGPQGKWWPSPSTKNAHPLSVCMDSVGPIPSKDHHWPLKIYGCQRWQGNLSCTHVRLEF